MSAHKNMDSKLLDRVTNTRQQYKAQVEAAALPGETFKDTEQRLKLEAAQKRHNQMPTSFIETSLAEEKEHKNQNDEDESTSTSASTFGVHKLYEVATKDNRSLMDVALFRLSKKGNRAGQAIRYVLPDGFAEVKAGPDGMASIWDYDIVLMLISHLTDATNRYRAGKAPKPGKVFIPHLSDITKFCRRGSGGRQADELENALDRLYGTVIKSVRTSKNGTKETKSESLIGPYRVVSRSGTGKILQVEIDVPNWIYDEITSGKKPDVLTVTPEYFLIKSGLGRFIYRLARRAAGKNSAKWAFKTIYERSGSSGTFKEFCRMLRKLIQVDDLPEYSLLELEGATGPQLLMVQRDAIDTASSDNEPDIEAIDEPTDTTI